MTTQRLCLCKSKWFYSTNIIPLSLQFSINTNLFSFHKWLWWMHFTPSAYSIWKHAFKILWLLSYITICNQTIYSVTFECFFFLDLILFFLLSMYYLSLFNYARIHLPGHHCKPLSNLLTVSKNSNSSVLSYVSLCMYVHTSCSSYNKHV